MNSIPKLACIYFTAAGTVVAVGPVTTTFDDLRPSSLPGYDGTGAPVPNGYAGLRWNNFAVLNAVTFRGNPSGYQNGIVSLSNVVVNLSGAPAFFSDGTFDLNSAYLTGAWNDGLQVRVQGFTGATLAYDNTYTVVSTAPTLIDFNYLGIDSVKFSSFGGTPHGYGGAGVHFVMDNLTVTIVPEPSTLALAGLGAALIVSRRRK